MVSRNDVVAAYRLILGREPENEQVVEGWMQAESVDHLRQGFMSGTEFRTKLGSKEFFANVASVGRHLHGPRMQLDLNLSPAQLNALLHEVATTWSNLGETEPHWSVITNPKFKREQISQSEAEFYATGALELRTLQAYFDRNGEDLSSVKTVVELGCGVGRITSHLASSFPNVVGLDVSGAHLKIARSYCERNGIGNVEFVQLAEVGTISILPDFDLFFTIISLQHSPPPIIHILLKQIMARARPGAYLLFQVPTYREGYTFNIADYSKQQHTEMEMHPLPQRCIFQLLKENDFDLIEVQEDNMPGDVTFASHTFFARKSRLRN